MADVLNPQKALIFRITHRDNLPWILEHGLHAPNGALFDPNHRNIGSPDLIGKRTTHVVSVGPQGTLSDYIPFYFTPFSIMMYNIHTGRNVPKVPNEEIIVMISSLHQIAHLGIPFVFTDQHAFRKTASYFTELADLNRVDFPLLNRRDFRKYDTNDLAKTDRYQAEALIWKYLPVEALLGIASYTHEVDTWLKAEILRLGKNVNTSVLRNWYFT
jgi:hypothetical protein